MMPIRPIHSESAERLKAEDIDSARGLMITPLEVNDGNIRYLMQHCECVQCGECCRTSRIVLLPEERARFSRAWRRQHLNEAGEIKPPCPFLARRREAVGSGMTLCSIYPKRPASCANFPVNGVLSSVYGDTMVLGVTLCPAGKAIAKALQQ